MTTPRLALRGVAKTFTMHLRDGIRLPRASAASPSPSRPANASCSAGRRAPARARSSRCVYGNYAVDSGAILARRTTASAIDIATAEPARGARGAARHDRLCQPVPARRAARRGARHRRRAADRAGRRARGGPRPGRGAARAAQPAARGCGTCRRPPSPAASSSASTSRAASSPPSAPAARRADRLARRGEPRGRRRPDRAKPRRTGASFLGIFHDEEVRDRGRRPRHRRDRLRAGGGMSATRLGPTPLVAPDAEVVGSTLGAYVEVGPRTRISHSTFGDYCYIMEDGQVLFADDRQVLLDRLERAHQRAQPPDLARQPASLHLPLRRLLCRRSPRRRDLRLAEGERRHRRPRRLDRPWRDDHRRASRSATAR